MPENFRYVVVGPLFQQNERLFAQGSDRNAFILCQRMVFREYRQKTVLFQKNRFEIRMGRQKDKPAVHTPLLDPAFDFGIIAGQKFILDIRIIRLESTDDVRQPVRRHTGKRADTDQAGLQAVQLIHFHLQFPVFFTNAFRERQQFQAFRRQFDSGALALQKRHFPFAFQIADHAADPRLGIKQHFGGFRKAAVFHGLDESLILLNVLVH